MVPIVMTQETLLRMEANCGLSFMAKNCITSEYHKMLRPTPNKT